MLCPALDQLNMDTGSSPVRPPSFLLQAPSSSPSSPSSLSPSPPLHPPSSHLQPHSAPESRRNSWLLVHGEPARKEMGEEEELCDTINSRATSLPNCSQPAPPSPSSSSLSPFSSRRPASSSATSSPRRAKSPQQEARQAFKDRSSSSPTPCPPTQPPTSPPSSSAGRHKRHTLSYLRHHTSLDSAALACDFFGHTSSASTLSVAKKSRPKIQRSQTVVQEDVEGEECMTSSPLLRRPHVMASSPSSPSSSSSSLQSKPGSAQGQPGLSIPLLHQGGWMLPGKAGGGAVPQVYTNPPRRRLTITLPSSLPVSPVPCRSQGAEPQSRSPGHGGRSPQVPGPQGRSPSLDSCSSGEPSSPSSYFRVVVLGDTGVGKTTLIRQMALVKGTSCGLPEGGKRQAGRDEQDWLNHRVIVNIDRHDEHCALEIFDNPLDANIDHLRPDAFIVVYSVSDRKSYLTAKEVTRHLRCELGMDRPVFLVGNKTDLRRQQRVASREARDVAEAYDCSVLETSAALRINVDTLLLQVLDSILQQLAPPAEWNPSSTAQGHRSAGGLKARGHSPGRAIRLVSKILRRAFLRRSVSSEALGVC
ncbi:hypothetical protein ACOMHN_031117 [Nucella lapillus]